MRVIQMNPSSTPQGPKRTYQHTLPTLPAEKSPLFDIKNFKTDDWILLGIIAALVLEGCEDYLLLCALGYLFLVGLQNS